MINQGVLAYARLSKFALLAGAIIGILAAANHSRAQSGCQAAVNELNKATADLKDTQAELKGLQADMKTAVGQQKSVIANQIKNLLPQISSKQKLVAAKEKQLEKCLCPDPPDSYYKLPFDGDPAWELCNGNWDDPINGHNKGDPNGGQAYAFDFVYSPNHNCVGTAGHNIKAVRSGVVISLAGDRSCNVYGVKAGDPCYGAPGEGNYVLIRHADNTVAAYDHLMKGKVFVTKGQQVARGQVIALSGNTGNSSTPHVHLDVRKFWKSPSDFGPTLPIKFQDKNHVCWRPRVGDVLASNNF